MSLLPDMSPLLVPRLDDDNDDDDDDDDNDDEANAHQLPCALL